MPDLEIIDSHNGAEGKAENKTDSPQLAAVSYIPPLCLVTLLISKSGSLVRLHARQALVILLAGLAVYYIFPYSLQTVSFVVLFVLSMYGFLSAAAGRDLYIPGFDALLNRALTWPFIKGSFHKLWKWVARMGKRDVKSERLLK